MAGMAVMLCAPRVHTECEPPSDSNDGGYFKAVASSYPCSACRTCRLGAEEVSACTSTADRTCGCVAGYETTGMNHVCAVTLYCP